MGKQFRFECIQCGLKGDVSGGSDRGIHTYTKTVYCEMCGHLHDIAVHVGRHWKRSGGDVVPVEAYDPPQRCCICTSDRLTKWNADDPCPACGGFVVAGPLLRVWD